VSDILRCEVHFDNRPGDDEKTTIDRATVFGDVPVSSLKPDWTPERMPDYFQLASRSFLEIGAVYLLTSGSVDHLQALRLQPQPPPTARWSRSACSRPHVAFADDRGCSTYGAERSQPVATGGKRCSP
jgi:hypothetical protein